MIPNPTPPPDLTSFFNRFSNEELHQIGLPRIIRPSLETISSIPPLMNHQPNCSEVRPLMEQQTTPVTSTPRRPASDSFDNSDGNRQRMKKRLRINDLPPRNEQVEQHHLPTLVPPHHHQHYFNMNVLKRAVSSNLPCFFIIFGASVEPKNIPSSIQVAIMLKKLFADNQIPIKELSMCVQAGERRFKFAVGDKVNFLTLFNWTWPEEIDNKKAEFIKPHTLPDCYALVVRYVPLDINQDIARQEILKTIPAAVGLTRSSINWSTLSASYYISYWLSTYILYSMLENWSHERQMSITGQLSEELKLAVDKALASGAIKRSAPGEVSRPFQQQTNDFPLLNQGQVISRPAWTTSDNGSLHSNLKQEMSDLVVTIKALSETMIRTEKSFNDLNNRIEVQHKSTILHCNSICAIIDTVQIMSSWVQEEWYSNSTLDSVLTKWENNPCPLPNQFIPLNVLTYNVQGWGTRALEVMDLIFKVDSPVCVFTEVGELWNSFKVPHFTSFYQKGTNHSGGVMITIGKHFRATRIDTDIENTVIVDIHGLSEQIRIIGIY
ncbi:unnamed protein product [Rotaria magnacalcarata]|uniref:Uncharacterized protein n=1 Tax=Rotaria magnacalcarata TaxID=392030 RepID=A0A820DWS0_9BILA|nr:unnamed protein product [Rotaria magnacalcarata]